uniref:Ribosomal protein L20 n=1 Tax=Romanomermis culicivorax TaxID=13658 RepID=A0A915I5X4_ROMCU
MRTIIGAIRRKTLQSRVTYNHFKKNRE